MKDETLDDTQDFNWDALEDLSVDDDDINMDSDENNQNNSTETIEQTTFSDENDDSVFELNSEDDSQHLDEIRSSATPQGNDVNVDSEISINDIPDDSSSALEPLSIEPVKSDVMHIPVQLNMLIGSFTLTRKEIGLLQPGELIKLKTDYYKKISIRVNDIEIGVGEIVEVDGQFAVRIFELWRS